MTKVNTANQHYGNFIEFNQLETTTGKYYEFGAGWTLAIPLSMTFLGFDVYCVDIRKLIIPDLINDGLEKFNEYRDELPFEVDKVIEPIVDQDLLGVLARDYKLNYIAPKDARDTGFEKDGFDFISSSVTLEHIPRIHILPILQECYRLLAKGGVVSVTIDYQDHWSFFDKNISIYNFLKYSAKDWRKYNPSLHFQNRMRHSEYMDIIAQTDFKVVKEVPMMPTAPEREALASLELADEFKKFSIEELEIKGSEIVLMK